MLLTIRDESAAGSVTSELTLEVLSEIIMVKELIRSRIYQEVDEHNRRLRERMVDRAPFRGLVTPTDHERSLNGSRLTGESVREIDWNDQFSTACIAFEKNGFFILVGNRQVEKLEEIIFLRHDSQVSFVKLAPLVGG